MFWPGPLIQPPLEIFDQTLSLKHYISTELIYRLFRQAYSYIDRDVNAYSNEKVLSDEVCTSSAPAPKGFGYLLVNPCSNNFLSGRTTLNIPGFHLIILNQVNHKHLISQLISHLLL
jgi:hypothetical protein